MTKKFVKDSEPFGGWEFSRVNNHGEAVFLKTKLADRLNTPLIEIQIHQIADESDASIYPLTINDAKALVEKLQNLIKLAEMKNSDQKSFDFEG